MPWIAKFWIVLAFVLAVSPTSACHCGYSTPSSSTWPRTVVGALSAWSGIQHTSKDADLLDDLVLDHRHTALVVWSLLLGGYSFNLGASEAICFFGVIGTLSVWTTVGDSLVNGITTSF